MKKRIPLLFILVWFAVCLGAQNVQFPEYEGWVSDYTGVIPDDVKAGMTAVAEEVNIKTGAEIAVVTVPDMQGLVVQDYATRLFEKWGIGKKGKDNGVLILLSMEERKIWIETGYGIEGILPDGLVGEILDRYALPDFKEGRYGDGLYRSELAVAGVIAKDAGVQITGAIEPEIHQGYKSHESSAGGFILFAIFVLLVILTKGRIIPWILLSMMSGGRGGGGGWGGGGGGFGGGFGGFGGGRSGGGGAGRSF
jgi:uncharacterized protein